MKVLVSRYYDFRCIKHNNNQLHKVKNELSFQQSVRFCKLRIFIKLWYWFDDFHNNSSINNLKSVDFHITTIYKMNKLEGKVVTTYDIVYEVSKVVAMFYDFESDKDV